MKKRRKSKKNLLSHIHSEKPLTKKDLENEESADIQSMIYTIVKLTKKRLTPEYLEYITGIKLTQKQINVYQDRFSNEDLKLPKELENKEQN